MALDRTGDYVGGNARSPTPTGGTFEVDLDKIPGLIAGLEDVVQSLMLASRTIRQVSTVLAPGGDPFSEYATGIFRQTADGGPGALLAEHEKFAASLVETIDNYKAMLQGAQAQESANASGLRAGQ